MSKERPGDQVDVALKNARDAIEDAAQELEDLNEYLDELEEDRPIVESVEAAWNRRKAILASVYGVRIPDNAPSWVRAGNFKPAGVE